MEPEISRRCRTCGAAVRSRAGFCPQCGTPVNAEGTGAEPAVSLADTVPSPAEDVLATTMASDSAAPAIVSDEPGVDAERVEPETAPVLAEEPEAAQVTEVKDEAAAVDAAAAQSTRRHRVKVAARDAMEGKIAPRMEKLRHASTVVLDEAADDPGLRFVLVAAVLILLSLGLLLLSQILD